MAGENSTETNATNANAGANNNESVGANAANQNNTQGQGTESNKAQTNPMSFDDFLKESKNQAEFDKRVQQAIETAETKWKSKNDAEKSEAERLAKMNKEEQLEYKLKKSEEENLKIQKQLQARDLKDEAIKIATSKDTAFDPEFLELFNYEHMTAKELKEKTTLIKTIQDRIVEKAVSEWSKEKPPYNPNPLGEKPKADDATRKAMGLK